MKKSTKFILTLSMITVFAFTLVFGLVACTKGGAKMDAATEAVEESVTEVGASSSDVVNGIFGSKTKKNNTHTYNVGVGSGYTKINMKKNHVYYINVSPSAYKDGQYQFTTYVRGANVAATIQTKAPRDVSVKKTSWQNRTNIKINSRKTTHFFDLDIGKNTSLGHNNWELEGYRLMINPKVATTLYISFSEYRTQNSDRLKTGTSVIWKPIDPPESGRCNSYAFICKGVLFLNNTDAVAFGKMIGEKSFVKRMKQIYNYKVKHGKLQSDANALFLNAVKACNKENAKTLGALSTTAISSLLSTLIEYLFADVRFANELNNISSTLKNATGPMRIAFYSANPNCSDAGIHGYKMSVSRIGYERKRDKKGNVYNLYLLYGENCYSGSYQYVKTK